MFGNVKKLAGIRDQCWTTKNPKEKEMALYWEWC